MIKIKNRLFIGLFFILLISFATSLQFNPSYNSETYYNLFICDKDNDGAYQFYDLNFNEEECKIITEPFYIDYFDNNPILDNHIKLKDGTTFEFRIESDNTINEFVNSRKDFIEKIKTITNTETKIDETLLDISLIDSLSEPFYFLDRNYLLRRIEILDNIEKLDFTNLLDKLTQENENLPNTIIALTTGNRNIPKIYQSYNSYSTYSKYKNWTPNINPNEITIPEIEDIINNIKLERIFCDQDNDNYYSQLKDTEIKELFFFSNNRCILTSSSTTLNLDNYDNNNSITNQEFYYYTLDKINYNSENIKCQIKNQINYNTNFDYLFKLDDLSFNQKTDLQICKDIYFYINKTKLDLEENKLNKENIDSFIEEKTPTEIYNLDQNIILFQSYDNAHNYLNNRIIEMTNELENELDSEIEDEVIDITQETNELTQETDETIETTTELDNEIEDEVIDITQETNKIIETTTEIDIKIRDEVIDITNKTDEIIELKSNNENTEETTSEKTELVNDQITNKDTSLAEQIKLDNIKRKFDETTSIFNTIEQIEIKENIEKITNAQQSEEIINKVEIDIENEIKITTDKEKQETLETIKDKIKNTKEQEIEEKIEFQLIKNLTKIKVSYNKDNNTNKSIIQRINKSIIKSASEIIYNTSKYKMTILIDDPLIMWDILAQEKEKEELEIEFYVDKNVKNITNESIETIIIENEDNKENKENKDTYIKELDIEEYEEKDIILSIIFVLASIPLVIFFLVAFQKYKKKEKSFEKIYNSNNQYQQQYYNNYYQNNSKLNINEEQKNKLYNAINKMNK